MTDHGGAASPRIDLADRIEAEVLSFVVGTESEVRAGLAVLRLVRSAIEAAQEAPAPKGLRAALGAMCDAWASGGWRLAKDYSALEAVYEAALRVLNDLDDLAATPPTPAEPPRLCADCGKPDWEVSHGAGGHQFQAEARPPEGLDR